MTLVDGGAGDEDRSADGLIEDPGGPGIAQGCTDVHRAADRQRVPPATFNYFLEECTETRWALGVHVTDATSVGRPARRTSPAITDPQAVTLANGQTFTWDNLESRRHYRIIQVGPPSPSRPAPSSRGDSDAPPPGGI